MAGSLKDQLRQSGLVSAHDARKAGSEQRKKKRKQNAGHGDEDAARRAALQRQLADKAEHDRQLNAERQRQADARAVQAQVRQLIEMNRLDRGRDADVAYHFEVDGRIQQMYLSAALHAAVVAGQVAVVRGEDGQVLLPRAAAEKIRQREAGRILVLNDTPAGSSEDDDPYAEFKVPDDLMW